MIPSTNALRVLRLMTFMFSSDHLYLPSGGNPPRRHFKIRRDGRGQNYMTLEERRAVRKRERHARRKNRTIRRRAG